MPKIAVIYGTGTHNTERMALAVGEGARAEGVDVVIKNVNEADRDELKDADTGVPRCRNEG